MNGDYRAFRITLVVLAIVTQVLVIAAYIDAIGFGAPPWFGHAGASINTHYRANEVRVISVEPGGPAERAGLRAGDIIDERANSPLERWQWFESFPTPINGTPATFHVLRGGRTFMVTVTPDRWDLRTYWYIWLGPAGDFFIATIGALIALRGSATKRNVLLSGVLVFLALGQVFASSNFAFPSEAAYVAVALVSLLVIPAKFAWIAHAATFLRRRSISFSICAAVMVVVQVYVAMMMIAEAIALSTLAIAPGPWFYFLIPQTIGVVAGVSCSIIAIGSADESERPRAAWSLGALCLFFVVFLFGDYLADYVNEYNVYLATLAIYNVNEFGLPVVLAYAALSRRLIDIGFVLNRAAVFTLVSAIVVGAFVLLEYTVGTWLTDVAHITSAVVGAMIALALGLSLRFVHHYIDRFVDRVFFRKRHEDEKALHDFAFEATFITDKKILLERTIAVVERHTGTIKASIVVPGVDVSDDDPAILAMRAWRKPIELHAVPSTAIDGEYAFPMLSRGTLVGVLVCAQRSNHEAFAPDERAALQSLAHGVALTLDTLSDKHDDATTLLLKEIRGMREAIVSELRAARSVAPSVEG